MKENNNPWFKISDFESISSGMYEVKFDNGQTRIVERFADAWHGDDSICDLYSTNIIEFRELKDKKIDLSNFCADNGAREVHRSWRDNMLFQNRKVADNRMVFDDLDINDKELDTLIAIDVITDFLVYCKGNGYTIEDIEF